MDTAIIATHTSKDPGKFSKSVFENGITCSGWWWLTSYDLDFSWVLNEFCDVCIFMEPSNARNLVNELVKYTLKKFLLFDVLEIKTVFELINNH